VSKSILQFLGFDLGNIPPDAQWEFVWTSADALGSWRIFAFIGALLLMGWFVFYMYRREMDSCPMKARIFLGVVRSLVLLTLAIVFLGPAIRVKEIKIRQDVILVLIDESLSMLTPDRYLDAMLLPVSQRSPARRLMKFACSGLIVQRSSTTSFSVKAASSSPISPSKGM